MVEIEIIIIFIYFTIKDSIFFVNFEKKLIIELDGGQHKIQKEEDKERDNWLEEQGFEVLRFWNNEVFESLEGILDVVREKLLSPSPIPSRQGRGDVDED